MNSRNTRGKALAIVAAGAAILATAACGSDDNASGGVTYTDGEACIMAGTPASAVTTAASPYIYKTDPQPAQESIWSKPRGASRIQAFRQASKRTHRYSTTCRARSQLPSPRRTMLRLSP